MATSRRTGGLAAGVVLIALGGLLLAENLGWIEPIRFGRLFARWWPLLLVAMGLKQLLDGARRSGVILLCLGGFLQLLVLGYIDRWDISRFWPVVLIAIGLSMILKRGRAGGGT